MTAAKARRHPSQRPPQFNRRATPARDTTVDTDADCGWGSRKREPCGGCDRCQYESAMYLADHPATLSREELARL